MRLTNLFFLTVYLFDRENYLGNERTSIKMCVLDTDGHIAEARQASALAYLNRIQPVHDQTNTVGLFEDYGCWT